MYLEIDEGFLEHPKTVQLCSAMQNPLAFGYMLHFWKWACRCCQDGDLRGMNAYAIEEVSRYHQHDGKLFTAMTAKIGGKSGFVDVDESGAPVSIHNWPKRTGGSIKRMEDEADRKRLRRLHNDGKCNKQTCRWCNKSVGCPEDVRGMSGGQADTVQSSPVQNRTDLTPPARDPGVRATEPAPLANAPGKPTPSFVADRFGVIRAETCGGSKLFWQASPKALEKLADWLGTMQTDAVVDVEKAMKLACEKVRDGAKGWTGHELTDPNFLLGAVIAKWSALREEIHGVAPKAKEAEKHNQHEEKPKPVTYARLT